MNKVVQLYPGEPSSLRPGSQSPWRPSLKAMAIAFLIVATLLLAFDQVIRAFGTLVAPPAMVQPTEEHQRFACAEERPPRRTRCV